MTYYLKGAYNQMSLLADREPIEKSLNREDLSSEEKRKIALAKEAKEFAENKLGLKKSKSYSTFVKLNRPYVTWVLNATEPYELKNYEWSYLIVGKMPYKGFFSEADALKEQETMRAKGFDTYVRGVSAYSTLGWFNDPVLSTFLNYSDHDLVDTIIHELVHITIYIKNSADFNERLAVFLGNKGMRLFYQEKEGTDSPTLKRIEDELADEKLFSAFINDEISHLKVWYANPENHKPSLKEIRLREIQERFKNNIQPKMRTGSRDRFLKNPLNNAYLGLFMTYNSEQDDFETLYRKSGNDFQAFLEKVKLLEKSDDPQKDLRKLTE